MTAVVSRERATATWLTGVVGLVILAASFAMMACAAPSLAQILSFPAPIAVTAITLMAAALLNSLRRHLRAHARHRSGLGHPHSLR